jgi:hypothetical protein
MGKTIIEAPPTTNLTGGFINGVDLGISILNNSKVFAATLGLLMHLGAAKYIQAELSQLHEDILSNIYVRRFLIFAVIFISTRDIKLALVLTAVFVILISGIFNEDSKYCILPNVECNPRKITKEEYHYAQNILEKYHKQIKKNPPPESNNTNNTTPTKSDNNVSNNTVNDKKENFQTVSTPLTPQTPTPTETLITPYFTPGPSSQPTFQNQLNNLAQATIPTEQIRNSVKNYQNYNNHIYY